jgi:hypothetical protein
MLRQPPDDDPKHLRPILVHISTSELLIAEFISCLINEGRCKFKLVLKTRVVKIHMHSSVSCYAPLILASR